MLKESWSSKSQMGLCDDLYDISRATHVRYEAKKTNRAKLVLKLFASVLLRVPRLRDHFQSQKLPIGLSVVVLKERANEECSTP